MSTSTKKVTLATLAGLRARGEKAVFISDEAAVRSAGAFVGAAGRDAVKCEDGARDPQLPATSFAAVGAPAR